MMASDDSKLDVPSMDLFTENDDSDVLAPISPDRQSLQQRMLNESNSSWNFCKTNDLDNLRKSILDFSRGLFGENLLHVALLYKANDCAKWLITNHPKLCMEVYREDEYHGESVLHMAIATENFEILDFVLSQNVEDLDLNVLINDKRAIGHFFHPKWGTVDYGEHALSFAVCLNQKETVTKLLENGADIYCVNSVGNTVFHFCAKYNLVGQKKLTNVTPFLTTSVAFSTKVMRRCVTFVSFFLSRHVPASYFILY